MLIKNKTGILIAGILILFLTSFVTAFGVGTGYSIKYPLEMYPGQKISLSVTLDNNDIEGGASFKGEIIEGSEIATLDKGIHKIPQGEKEKAEMKIKIPENAIIGQQFLIKYRFEQVSEEGESGVSFSQGISSGFNVKVIERPPEAKQGISTTTITLILLALIILVAIIIWIVLKRKNNQTSQLKSQLTKSPPTKTPPKKFKK